MRSHTHLPLESPPQAQLMYIKQPKNQKLQIRASQYLYIRVPQTSISSISPQSILDLDTDHSDMID